MQYQRTSGVFPCAHVHWYCQPHGHNHKRDSSAANHSEARGAAAQAIRRQGPARLVVAVPVAASETCAEFRNEVDEVVCAVTPEPFHAVGLWYEDFSQTTDDEARELLARRERLQTKPTR